MEIDSQQIVFQFVAILCAILLVGIGMRILKQPHVIAYLVTGVLIGPFGIGLADDKSALSALGELGVIFLLFFVGMEVPFKSLISNWRISILGTIIQIVASVGTVFLIGNLFGWSLERAVFLGFVISLSSTALVLKVLESTGELKTKIGTNILGILIVQDMALIPMLIILNFFGGSNENPADIAIRVVAGAALIGFVSYLIMKKKIKVPFSRLIKKDHELQVFGALGLCFGFAVLTGSLGLSVGLGAFIAGLTVSSIKETGWIHERLDSFRVLFIALFFISIGLLVDVAFIRENLFVIAILVLDVFLVNTLVNSITLRLLGENMRESIYSGAILSQIGELSFIVGAVGFSIGIVSEFDYKMIISVIALTLVFTPFWIQIVRKALMHEKSPI